MKTFEFTDEQVLTIITALGVLKDRIGQKAGWQTEAEIAKRRRHDQFVASQNYRKSVDYIHNVLGWNEDE